VGRRGEELLDGLLEGLDRDSLVRLGEALDQVGVPPVNADGETPG
jgi:hypothetical protein